MDKENGKKVYEIEFVKGKKEYEYTINAKSGKVISVDVDLFWLKSKLIQADLTKTDSEQESVFFDIIKDSMNISSNK